MELFYNPNVMPEDEVRKTFVARQKLVDELVGLVERQPDGAGVQHVVIIAPRGMGKTTVLLMVSFTIKDRGLDEKWQAVKFPEESYGINDLADLWLEIASCLSSDTADPAVLERAKNLRDEYPDYDDLQEALLALLKDWRRKHGKRLLLLIDNFDLIFEQINDERDNARLREVLMNDGTMMVIGGATTFFHEARAYDQPLYNFFRIETLDDLKYPQMQELLRKRAELDRLINFEEILKANAARFRLLEYFTGGNPRLVLMLYRVLTQSDLSDVRRGLEKLLDEVTPYYKAKTETLPAQQRKILDYIARISSKTREGVTPTEIAKEVRSTPNQVSSQLKRLSDLGYVRAANLRERNSYYMLSEPLYAIWHQMRFGHDARRRMQWLVDFMKVWYEAEEMGVEDLKLETRFRDHLSASRLREARDTLEHRRYLALAMEGLPSQTQAHDSIICGYLDMSATETLKKDVLPEVDLKTVSAETRKRLLDVGCITEQQFNEAEAFAARRLAYTAYQEKRYEDALRELDRALSINPEDNWSWHYRGLTLGNLNRCEEEIESYDRALSINPGDDFSWYNRGNALHDLERYEEAIESYDHALSINSRDYWYWHNRGVALRKLNRLEEAVENYDRALSISPEDNKTWLNRAIAYLFKYRSVVIKSGINADERDWHEALNSAKHADVQQWADVLLQYLMELAEIIDLAFVRQLIAESGVEERLFPLARAIDYLLTRDEALIEKLSPEVRGIVEEIIKKLGNAAGSVNEPAPGKRKGKSKSNTRRRTSKRL